jgi:hypothetical protein
MYNRISEIRPGLKIFSNYCNLCILVLGFRGLFEFRLSLEVLCCGFTVLTVDVCMVCGSYLTTQSQLFIVLLQSTELERKKKPAKKYSNNILTNKFNIQTKISLTIILYIYWLYFGQNRCKTQRDVLVLRNKILI